MSLYNRCVVVTRAPQQALPLVQALQAIGANVLHCPVIQTEPVYTQETLGRLRTVLESTDRWTHVLFTSANAVTFFAQACAQGRWSLASFQQCVPAGAVGPQTAHCAVAGGWRVVVMPQSDYCGRGLADTFCAMFDQPQRVIVPRALVAHTEWHQSLQKQGHEVHDVIVYETVANVSMIESLREALLRGDVDAITLTSPSTIDRLIEQLGHRLLEEIPLFCIGETTAQAVRQQNLAVAATAPVQTIASLVGVMEEWFDATVRAEEG